MALVSLASSGYAGDCLMGFERQVDGVQASGCWFCWLDEAMTRVLACESRRVKSVGEDVMWKS